MNRSLRMTFNLDNEKTTSISLDNAKDELTADQVKTVMNDMISKDFLTVDDAKLASINKIVVVERSEKVLV